MCGIFGVINNRNSQDISLLKAVSEILEHRGPDDEGFLLGSTEDNSLIPYKGDISPNNLNLLHIDAASQNFNLALIHRRLSIIDLSSQGHQPMCYGNEIFWIVLNGEIYNYVEIKEELSLKGYQFNSNSDTEVILASYAEWGESCVSRFNGMWAFAIWDRTKNKLFLSRDRVGIKPLYYYLDSDAFIFSSEIKGISTYLKRKFKTNKNKIREYLIKGQVIIGESEDTIFDEVKQLLPGNNIVYQWNNLKIKKYWSLDLNIHREPRPFHVDRFKELFHDSLRLMLRSDVEVGSCLSGGIDSSSIVSYASIAFNRQFSTFSAIWPNTRHDESEFMRLVAKQYNCNAHYIESDLQNIIQLIDKITWHQELPLAGSSLIAQWNIMEIAKQSNVPVLLDGQGADEILSGYPFYIAPYINECFRGCKVSSIIDLLLNASHTGYGIKQMLKQQIRLFLNKKTIVPKLPISDFEMSQYTNSLKYQYPHHCTFLPDFLQEHILKSNLPSLLHFEDRNSMAHSIEARVPFLDHRLIEYCINIPSEYKIGNGYTKTILRDAMKGYVHDKIRFRRDKVGFSTPLEDGVFKNNNTFVKHMEDELFSSELWRSDLINRGFYHKKDLLSLYMLHRFLVLFQH